MLLLFLFGPYTLLGRWAVAAGLPLTDSFAGVVCAEVFVAAPFLIVAARSAFVSVDRELEHVAATLGHRPAARFFKVIAAACVADDPCRAAARVGCVRSASSARP